MSAETNLPKPPRSSVAPALADDKHTECDHGVTFDQEAATDLSASEVRKRWPRLFGECPKGCGFNGIGYASYIHYLSGCW